MKKTLKRIGFISLITLLALMGAVALFLGGLNIAKGLIYKGYYSVKTDICHNPGLDDGFICQGIAASEEKGIIIVSGYMKDKTDSRLYVTTPTDQVKYLRLNSQGASFTGHAGGVATVGDNVYVASGSRIYTIPLETVATAQSGTIIDIGEGVEINNKASFVYADDEYLYVGEFHDGGAYVITGHENQTAEGTHYAICSKYAANDLSKPVKVYSIRNKVQGICFTPDGKVIMSTSYGLSSSVYYVYNESEATDSGKTFDDAPLYYLDKLVKQVKGPAMAEGLDWYNGQVITLTESASDKYIFGKLFGAIYIVGLKF